MPHPRRRRVLLRSAAAAAALVVLGASGRTLWRIGQATELARLSEPLQHTPAQAALRLLIVGDSTAVGTGASAAQFSLAGRLAAAYPRLLIDNRARDGARWADVKLQLAGSADYDMVLVQAGGNDVIRLRGRDALRDDIETVTALALRHAALVVLMPAGNVGNAPFFFAPLSWLMSWRSRRLHALVQAAARRHGALYVSLYHERSDDPFVQQPGLNARDGLHPSDAGYARWFDELSVQADLPRHLAAARPPSGS